MEKLLFAVSLPQLQRYRARVRLPEGLQARGGTLRPKCRQFSRSRLHRNRQQLLGMSLDPNAGTAKPAARQKIFKPNRGDMALLA